jgi:hypothetical protein
MAMNDLQLYFAIGLPTLTALVGIGVNVGYFVAMNGRMNRIEDRLDRVMEAITEFDKRLTKVEIKLGIQP